MYPLFKPVLFLFSPEWAHRLTTFLLDAAAAFPPTRALLQYLYCPKDARWITPAMGLAFPNPVGLAAGFDKDGKHLAGMACLGFGFIEVGTVTPEPQEGNPRPRLFRLLKDEALVNRMGFNNQGLEALAQRLKRWRQHPLAKTVLIGGNIGKNKTTPNESAISDYTKCFDALFPWVDYFAVNVSSPNTPNLRALQEKEPLTQLLLALQSRNERQPQPKPVLLKIAPDLTETQLDDIIAIVRETRLAGIIATNTTIDRSGLRTDGKRLADIGAGGLSGLPLRQRSTEVIRYLREKLGPDYTLIGVGGIDSAQAAGEKIEAGANLVQIYTGLVYQGPALVRRILTQLPVR